MIKLARHGRMFTIGGYIVMIISTISILITPIFGLSFRIINNITDVGERFLPCQTYYPYDFTKSPYYEFTYLIQIVSIVFVSTSLAGVTTFFGVLVFHVCGQLKILSTVIQDLTLQILDAKSKSRSEIGQVIKNIVDRHLHLIRWMHSKLQFLYTLI